MDFYTVPRIVSESSGYNFDGADRPDALSMIFDWVKDYLCMPHPDLGREGAVCPFTRPAADLGKLWVAIAAEDAKDFASLSGAGLEAQRFFMSAPDEPDDKFYLKAVIVAFPHLDHPEGYRLIESVQKALKPQFVQKGMMFGQFYKDCPEPGLINPHFRPLVSPVPLLAVRYMVKADESFLKNTPELMTYYYKRFDKQKTQSLAYVK